MIREKIPKEFIDAPFPDVHRGRMKALLKKYPEIKKLYGYDIKIAITLVLVVMTQTVIAYVFSAGLLNWPWYIWAAVIFFIGAPLTHWCAMGIHEASHNCVAKKPWQNNLISIIANFPILIPSAMGFARHHKGHHLYMGDVKRDNSLPSLREVKLVQNSRIKKLIWQTCAIFNIILFRGGLKKPTYWENVNNVLQISYLVFVGVFLGSNAFIYLGLSMFIGFGLHPVAGHYLHDHYITKEGQETYSYYGPINYITFNAGYHVEHHDTVAVPGTRLPMVKKIAPEFYENLDSSTNWTKVFWEFFTTKDIGLYSRYQRRELLNFKKLS